MQIKLTAYNKSKEYLKGLGEEASKNKNLVWRLCPQDQASVIKNEVDTRYLRHSLFPL